jgi:hypothetical protein
LSGCAHERLALLVLTEARCLSDKHDGGLWVADAKDHLAPTELGERASLAIVKRVGELLQGSLG